MGLFKKKQQPVATTEVKCPVEGCSFTCNHPKLLERHLNWKHPEKTETAVR